MNFGDNRLPARIWSKAIPEPNTGCFIWLGAQGRGMGYARVGKRMVAVHRMSYEAFVGPIPYGLEIDHKCKTPLCLNPLHLQAVTGRENQRLRVVRRRTCRLGHSMDVDSGNVRIYAYLHKGSALERRVCRKCEVISQMKSKARKAAK